MQEILLHVLPESVLPFAMTCKHNCQISLPILNRHLTVTDATLRHFYYDKVFICHPSLIWIRYLKLSGNRALASISSESDDVNPFVTILSSLTLLRYLDIAELYCEIPKFQHILQILPETMESVVMRVTSPRVWDVATWTRTVR